MINKAFTFTKSSFLALKVFAFLCFFWLLLSFKFGLFFMASMVVCCGFVTIFLAKINALPNLKITKHGVKYLLTLLREIFLSSIFVVKMCASSDEDISKLKPSLKTVSFKKSLSVKSLVMHANSITMTPGTVVVEVNESRKTMLVHGLDNSMVASLPNDWVV